MQTTSPYLVSVVAVVVMTSLDLVAGVDLEVWVGTGAVRMGHLWHPLEWWMARDRGVGSRLTIGLIAVAAAMVVAVGSPVGVVVDTMVDHAREDSVVAVAHAGMAQADVGVVVTDYYTFFYYPLSHLTEFSVAHFARGETCMYCSF